MLIVNEITSKYGAEGRRTIGRFLKVSISLARANNRMKFLLNCRRCKIVPQCLDVKMDMRLDNEISKRELEKVIKKHRIRLLSVMIADTKRTIEWSKKRKQEMGRIVGDNFNPDDAEKVRKMVDSKTVAVYRKVREREQQKFSRLQNTHIMEMNAEQEWLENTTGTELPDFVERTLMLGPNFNLENDRGLPYIEMVASIEKYVQRKENADEIRSEVANAMINHVHYKKQPRHSPDEWIRKDVMKSKKFLKDNPDLVVTKADKGSKTVIMKAEEYHSKMKELLADEDTYRKLSTNPTSKVLRKINRILDEWHTNGYIDYRTLKKLKESSCHPPRIYGLPKIHKINRPLRPVVSTIDSATYNIAKYLSSIIGNIIGKQDSHVRNSFEFANEIAGFQTGEEEVLFSLDVVSLYTNVPVDYAVRCLEERWREVEAHTEISKESFMAAVKLVLESTFFVYQGEVYGQTFGVPMGSPLSPVIANMVLEKLEQECRTRLEEKNVKLSLYRRYVDDCMCVADKAHIQTILETFNGFHERLQFTVEIETEGEIKFLDMMLERGDTGICTKWLPKQINGRYLDYTSNSPFQHKRNTAIALVDRAVKLTCGEKRAEALKQATEMLVKNNYPLWFINDVKKKRVHRHYNSLESTEPEDLHQKFVAAPYIPGLSEKLRKILRKYNLTLASKPRNKVKQQIFSKMKDPIPPGKQKNVVYSIPCGTDDGKVYIGQTKRMLEVRVAEHKNDCKKRNPRSGLAVHSMEEGHTFNFDKTRILDRIQDQETRSIAEVFHIKQHGEPETVNLQRECGIFCSTYNGLLAQLSRQRERDNPNERESQQTRVSGMLNGNE